MKFALCFYETPDHFSARVANLDEALEWAARCPAAAGGRVEVRPAMSTASM